MAFTEDFDSYSTGANPTEWGTDFGGATWTIEDQGGGDNKLFATAPGTGATISFCYWDDLGSSYADGTVIAQLRTSGGGTDTAVIVRGANNGSAETAGLRIQLVPTTNLIELREVGVGLVDSASVTIGNNVDYWIGVVMDGTSIKADVDTTRSGVETRLAGTPRIDTTVSTTSGGLLGFRANNANAAAARGFSYYYIELDSGGTTVALGNIGEVEASGYDVLINNSFDIAAGNEGTVAAAGYDPVVNKTTGVYVGSTITAYEVGGWLVARGYDVNTIVITPNIGEIAVAGYNPRLDVRVGNIGEVEVSKFNSTTTAVASTTPKLYVKWKDGSGNVRQREIINRPVISSVTAAHTANILEEIVLADASGGAFSVVLPTASGKTGFIYRVKKTDSSANAVTIDVTGAETIDGDATADLALQDEVIAVVSDGSNWWII